MKQEKTALPPMPVRIILLRALVVLSAFVLFAGTATAKGRAERADPPSFGHLERRLGALDLDAQTRTAIELVLVDAREDAQEIRGRLEKAQAALRQALEQEPPSESEVLARAEEAGRIGTELRKDQLEALLQIRAKLTPEQRALLRAEAPGRGRECARR
jgi:Spy/CpxP family protein refolding chaperone